MYMPRVFEVNDLDRSLALIGQNALGTLVVSTDDGFEVNHLPFVVDIIKDNQLRLRAHIPRANSLSSMLVGGKKCVVTFNGADGYISPSWYATKKEHGKVDTSTSNTRGDTSTSTLLSNLATDMSELMRGEVYLARAELREAVKDAKKGALGIGIGTAVLTGGVLSLIAFLVQA